MDVRETLDRLNEQNATLQEFAKRFEEMDQNFDHAALTAKAEALTDPAEQLQAKIGIVQTQSDLLTQRALNELMQRMVALEGIAVQLMDRVAKLDGQGGVEDSYARSHQ